MSQKLSQIPQLLLSELSDREQMLWQLLREREDFIAELKDEIARLKGEKAKPKIKPSRLEPSGKSKSEPEAENNGSTDEEKEKKKRPGSAKRSKTKNLEIHETKIIQPIIAIPEGSEFRGYQDYTVQDLIIKSHNVLYRLAIWQTPEGKYLRGSLAQEIREQGHFGALLKTYILYQYYHCHVTQPLLLEQLREWEIDISSGQLNQIIVEGKEKYHQEKQEILRVGLSVSSYINTDDTGARHQGINSYCTHIGNEWFASLGRHSLASDADAGSDRWFETTPKKNRINFLELLRGEKTDYIVNPEALNYLKQQKFPQSQWQKLNLSQNREFKNQPEWETHLKNLGIVKTAHVRKATEGALLGAIINNGVSSKLGIISDGAGQFRLLEHGLCWVHAERLINKLIPLTQEHLKAVEGVQDQIWQFYQELKNYKNLTAPEIEPEKARLETRFTEIFSQSTCFESLNQVLARLKRRKSELLKVLDSLKKTCRKLGVSFWNYLRDRVFGQNQIPQLGQLIAKKAGSQCPLAMDNFVSST